MDQSSTLRRIVSERPSMAWTGASPTRVLAVSSGKGGVGKSNFVLNIGICLAHLKKKVLILDADMGLANLDILIGLATRYNLSHVLNGERSVDEVIVEVARGVHLLPAASGVEWMTNLSADQKQDFLQKMDALQGAYDILLIDTGAGISSNVLYFNLAAQTRIVIVTPEPTSLTDAYALIKVLHRSYRQKTFDVVVNQVESEREALDIYRNLTAVADRFIEEARIGYLGHVRSDPSLRQAVLRQKPVVEAFPDSPAPQDYEALARKMLRQKWN
ncbi:MinD/ParA family protein, partial [bacterium]|nr:MinD/ParA family protein [bacterium]